MTLFPILPPGKIETVTDDDGLILQQIVNGETQFILSKDKKNVCFYPDMTPNNDCKNWIALELLPLSNEIIEGKLQ